MQPITLATQNAMPARGHRRRHVVGDVLSARWAAPLGVAIFLSVLFSTAGGNIAHAYKNAAKTASFQSLTTDPSVTGVAANKPLLSILQGQKPVVVELERHRVLETSRQAPRAPVLCRVLPTRWT